MIDDPRRALLTGMTLGTLMECGVQVLPEVDDQGDYLPSFLLMLPEPAVPGTTVRLTVSLVE